MQFSFSVSHVVQWRDIPWPWLPLGLRGERVAANALKRQGYRIIYRSYRCPIGEIDLVAWEGDQLVFVEVRTRSRSDLGLPWETIGPKKQRKLSALAAYFLKHEPRWKDSSARFDVVSIEWPGRWFSRPDVAIYRDSFSLRGNWLT